MNERERIEQEIRNLKADLTSDASAYGDWKHIKYNEYIQRGLPAPYTDVEMNDYFEERDSIRNRIDELLAELENLSLEYDEA